MKNEIKFSKEEINKYFEKANISFQSGKWYHKDNKCSKVEDYLELVLPAGITPRAAIEIFLSPADGKNIPSIGVPSKYIEIDHGRFSESNWSSVDDDFFDRIRYTSASTDNGVLWVIKSDDNVFKPIILGSNREDNFLSLSNACRQITVGKGTFIEWIENKWNELVVLTNKTLMDIYSDKKLNQDEKLIASVDWICANIPNSILFRGNKLVASCKTITTETGSYFCPESFHFQTKSGEVFSILEHILDIFRYIVTKNNKKVDMPIAYSSVRGVNCFNYMDLDAYKKVGETPNWDFYLKRYTTDEAQVLMAYIWSIFDSRNKGRQALYIYDNGFTGKSVLVNTIASVLGVDLHFSLQHKSMSNNFGVAKIWDKRFVSIDDNKNKNILRTEFFHTSTGGGIADVEMKGKNSFSAKFDVKYIICGNILPEIDTTATHETSRVILLKPKMTDEILKEISVVDSNGNIEYNNNGKPKLKGDTQFPVNLFNEFPAFLSKCEDCYKTLCPTHMQIIVPETVEDEILTLDSENVIMYEELFTNHLVFDKNSYVSRVELQSMYKVHAPTYNLGVSNNEYGDFLSHLLKSQKAFYSRVIVNSQRVYVVKGIKLKSFVPPQLAGIIKDIEESDSTINFDD